MRAWLVALSLVGLLPGRAAKGEDAPPLPPAAGPAQAPSPEQAAEAVLAARRAADETALLALAARDEPDPWLVADELLRRERRDDAEAFAARSVRPATATLAGYVATWRPRDDDDARRRRVQECNRALSAGAAQQALEILGAEEASANADVVGVRLAYGRGLALAGLRSWARAQAAFARGAARAEALGWLARAGVSWFQAGYCGYEAADFPGAGEAYRHALAIHERVGAALALATTRGNLGNVLQAQGQHAEALSEFEKALPVQREVGDLAGVARTQLGIGNVRFSLGRWGDARKAYEQALGLLEQLGDRLMAATTRGNIANCHAMEGRLDVALGEHERVARDKEALGDERGVALSLNNVANVRQLRGDLAGALSTFQRALEQAQRSGDRVQEARALGGLGTVHTIQGDFVRALEILERTATMRERMDDRAGLASTLVDLATVHQMTGHFSKALGLCERALEACERAGSAWGVATVLNNMGNVYYALGEYARAMRAQERSLEVARSIGDRAGIARSWQNLANIAFDLGDVPRAVALNEQALAEMERLGMGLEAASVTGNQANAFLALGDAARARRLLERALAQHQALGDRPGETRTRINLARCLLALGDAEDAKRGYEQALEQATQDGAARLGALALLGVGEASHALGDLEGARAAAERSVRMARSLRARSVLLTGLRLLALVHLAAGDTGRASSAAQAALAELEQALGGLGEEEGAGARGLFTDLFGAGGLAAMRDGDAAEVLRFLESGRAGALLDTLDKREMLRWKAETLSAALREADGQARAALANARQTYDRAMAASDRAARAAAARALDEATEDARAVQARIEREVKRAAGLYYPRARALEEIQAALEPGEALVLYGLCLEEAVALVVEPEGDRLVSLGRRAELEAACEALVLSHPGGQPSEALATLRERLVAPLEGARGGEPLQRVLVSPEGPLCFLPWGALFDLPVAVTPSGTTHALLRDEEREPGRGVLALGDPDYAGVSAGAQAIYYRGKQLKPLPATRAEALRVGTVTLLGAQASEQGLKAALPQQARWRAVHFACHGLIDPKRPTLSSLALSRSGEDDGFLTGLEVLRMQIPADLIVLSACETATGKLVGGEGIVGLARAFMYAGASRVLCSLWKVDDEATAALMTRFYELWNPALSERSESEDPERAPRVEGSKGPKDGPPGLPAAEALREAQAFVKSQEKWKHPYYWAAWVLWGLP